MFLGYSIPKLFSERGFFLEGKAHDLQRLRSARINLSRFQYVCNIFLNIEIIITDSLELFWNCYDIFIACVIKIFTFAIVCGVEGLFFQDIIFLLD